MSSGTGSNSVYQITIGTAGIYNNDSDVDMAPEINKALENAPIGATIDLVFEPGSYGLESTILLPSNTNVIGNGATLSQVTGSNIPFESSAFISNADAVVRNGSIYDTNSDGTTTAVQLTPIQTLTMTTNSSDAIIDSNICVSGLVFNETGNVLNSPTYTNTNKNGGMFGIWFINATDIAIQNNVFIGGNDGSAFMNVVNSVVANNIGVGQNASYDNWDGPVNATVENNEAWQYNDNDQMQSGSIQFNPTTTGDPNNPGYGSNDAIVGNELAGDTPNNVMPISVWPCVENGLNGIPTVTSNYNLTEQGNVAELFDAPNAIGYYVAETQGAVIEDNLLAQADFSNGGWTSVFQDINRGTNVSSYGTLSGNLLAGEYSSLANEPFFLSNGIGAYVNNNAILGANTSSTLPFSGTSLSGNIDVIGTLSTDPAIASELSLSCVPDIILYGTTSLALIGSLAPSIAEFGSAQTLSVTLSTQFGSLFMGTNLSNAKYTSINGEASLIISGDLNAVDQALSDLEYIPSRTGVSDSIKIVATDSSGAVATRYIPILEEENVPTTPNIITIGSGFTDSLAEFSTLYPGQLLPNMPSLTGEMLIANGTNDYIDMGSLASMAFLGEGTATVQGGSRQEFIEAGSGSALLNLTGSGDVTVEGGAGSLTINARPEYSTASDLIEIGSSNATISGGTGAISIIGGLGNFTFLGGGGPTYLATLPTDGGEFQADLGSGNATVFALSGKNTITTEASTTNFIELGVGNTYLQAGGTNNVALGSGSLLIDALPGSQTNILSGGGWVTFIDNNVDLNLGATTQGNATLTPADLGMLVVGGNGGTSILGSAAPSEILLLGSGVLLNVTGTDTIDGGSLNDTVIGASGSLTFRQGTSGSNAVVIENDGDARLDFSGGADCLFGGTGFDSVNVSNASSSSLILGSGGGSVVLSEVNQAVVVTATATTNTIQATQNLGGNSTIASYGTDNLTLSGNSTVNCFSGSSDSIQVTGAAVVGSYGGSNATLISSGALQLTGGLGRNDLLSCDTVTLQSGIATISAANLNQMNITDEQAQLSFISRSILPQAVDCVGTGSITVSGGPGGGIFIGGSAGNNSLVGGAGVATLVGGGNGDYLESNSPIGMNMLYSGKGYETLVGGSQTNGNEFFINPGADTNVISNGSGTQIYMLSATAGNSATLTGSQAASAFNLFDVATGSGHDGANYVLNISPTQNFEIEITGVTTSSAPDCSWMGVRATPYENGGALITLGNQTSIVLNGFNSAQLSMSVSANGIITIK